MKDMQPKVLAAEVFPASPESDVTPVTGVTTSNGAASSVTSSESGGVTGVTTVPNNQERPCYRVFEQVVHNDCRRYKPGVWYFSVSEKNGETVPVEQWICGPLRVEAVTRDGQANNFGRLLHFRPAVGAWRHWSMPMDLLAGDGREVRAALLSMGLQIDPKSRNQLAQYLQARTPDTLLQCAIQVGWCNDSFVLPDVVIGPQAARVVFQSPEPLSDEYTSAGSLESWREAVAAMAQGNPVLTLVLSAAFSGPLLQLCHAESGGLHLVGDSSTGKTAAVEAACSVWGGSGYKRSWRTTSNGMEGAAALFNDGLLVLDEISECEPKEVGAIVYSLGNGQGKQRATRNGAARTVRRHRCMVLSNGERTIATTMQEGGYQAKAGQGVRLLDISASRTHGAWDELHGHVTGAAFSDALKTAAASHYGHAGRQFLERLTRDPRDMAGYLEQFKALPAFAAEDGQHKRGAARLALIAMAGELATEYGITGWPEGEATAAAVDALRCWQTLRGSGPDERRQVLAKVSGFIDRHGDGRFSNSDGCGNAVIIRDRAGWWRKDGDRRLYMFSSAGMKEALQGFDLRRALDHLEAAGVLIDCGTGTERSKARRIEGRVVKVYTVDPAQL